MSQGLCNLTQHKQFRWKCTVCFVKESLIILCQSDAAVTRCWNARKCKPKAKALQITNYISRDSTKNFISIYRVVFFLSKKTHRVFERVAFFSLTRLSAGAIATVESARVYRRRDTRCRSRRMSCIPGFSLIWHREGRSFRTQRLVLSLSSFGRTSFKSTIHRTRFIFLSRNLSYMYVQANRARLCI